jgi:hypothetical protein
MHDAVELFLQLASEHLNVGSSKPDFMDYWEILAKKLGGDLQQTESMRRLNKSRVALKHHGTFPSSLDVEAFRGSTISFFEENTPTVFGVRITAVSLIEYVTPDASRARLKEAEKKAACGQILEALKDVAISFHEMIGDYESRKRDRFYRSPFYFGRDFGFTSSFFMGLSSSSATTEGRLGDFVDRVKESMEAMQEAIKILALGLDYRKYARFRQFAPTIYQTSGGYAFGGRLAGNDAPAPEDVRFCIDFVIEAALALAEFDYTMREQGH